MRVLLISHTCQSPTEGQPRPQEIAREGGIDLRVVIPDRWRHYGKWREPQIMEWAAFVPAISKVRLAWAGPAQFYLHYYPGLGKIVREFRPDIIDIWEE